MLIKSGAQWLLGNKPTQADAAAAREMKGLKPNANTHPNLFAWAAVVTKFAEPVSGKWAAGELPQPSVPVTIEKKDKKEKKDK